MADPDPNPYPHVVTQWEMVRFDILGMMCSFGRASGQLPQAGSGL